MKVLQGSAGHSLQLVVLEHSGGKIRKYSLPRHLHHFFCVISRGVYCSATCVLG